MGLEQQRTAFRAEFARTAPTDRAALYEPKIEERRAALRANNKALPGINGDDSWTLPVPATYVIGHDGRIVLASVDVDYRSHLGTETIVAALTSIRPD